MGYEIARADEMDRHSVESEAPDDLDLQMEYLAVTEALDLTEMTGRLWYFEPGEQMPYHAQREQEEFYYIIKGQFSIMIGEPGDEEFVEVGPHTMYAASAMVGHGHRYIGDDEGIVLAIGAPGVDDEGVDPYEAEE